MRNESLNGDTFATEMQCRIKGSVVDFKVTAIYDGETALHAVTYATYSPSVDGMSSSTITIVENYIGSCPAGMRPGDTKARTVA